MDPTRTDIASREVPAPPRRVYDALVEPAALASWLPPRGMSAEVLEFDPRPGGRLRLKLTYDTPGGSTRGKSTEDADLIDAVFTALTPHELVAWSVEFESEDPSFAGIMRMTWLLEPARGGTKVTIRAEDVPPGISKEDHATGLNSSLDNLARYLERSVRHEGQ